MAEMVLWCFKCGRLASQCINAPVLDAAAASPVLRPTVSFNDPIAGWAYRSVTAADIAASIPAPVAAPVTPPTVPPAPVADPTPPATPSPTVASVAAAAVSAVVTPVVSTVSNLLGGKK